MTYYLEICHPNEVILKKWKKIEPIESLSEIEHHLASPSFDWYPGLCVRVKLFKSTMYTGIFNDESCVDVGSNSNVMNTSRWPRPFHKFRSFIECWVENDNAEEMARAVEKILSRTQLKRAALEVAKLTLPFTTDVVIHNAAFVYEKYLDGEATESDRKKAYTEAGDAWTNDPGFGGNLTKSGIAAYVFYCTLANDFDYLALVCKYTQTLYLNPVAADTLRSSIPFYEIAKKIV